MTWATRGNRNNCKYYQDETGSTAILTYPDGSQKTTLGVNNEMSWTYTDSSGVGIDVFKTYPVGTYTFEVKWRVVFRCVSDYPGGPVVERYDCADVNQTFTYPKKT